LIGEPLNVNYLLTTSTDASTLAASPHIPFVASLIRMPNGIIADDMTILGMRGAGVF
jgi:hypothetical protein